MTYRKTPRRHWSAAVSARRWFVIVAFISAALITLIVFLVVGYEYVGKSLGPGESTFNLGFGALNFRAIIGMPIPQSGTSGLVIGVLLANLPQLVRSVLYFAYNSLFTCMLLCHEYSQFALQDRHKALRVSKPSGKQST